MKDLIMKKILILFLLITIISLFQIISFYGYFSIFGQQMKYIFVPNYEIKSKSHLTNTENSVTNKTVRLFVILLFSLLFEFRELRIKY